MQAQEPKPQSAERDGLERVVLVGFMGAGKSTVGPLLAARLGWRFADADHELENETGTSIADLFLRYGEFEFRAMEARIASRLLEDTGVVIALGGGAIESSATRTRMAVSKGTRVAFLKAPLRVLVARCEGQPNASVRPVLQQKSTLEQRYSARLPHYEAAHLTIDTDGLEPSLVADKLLHKLFESREAVQPTQKATTT